MSTQIERLQFYTDSGMALACAEAVQLASEIDSLKAKLSQVEADAAAMREALVFAARLDYLQEHNGIANRVRAALATGTGQRLLDELATLRTTAHRRLGLLRKCMWIPAKAGSWCPGCERLQEFGHKPDCPLAAELAGKEGAS